MRNGKLLMLNTLVLTVGTIIMRTVSVAFNVYLTNKIGASGIGLFQLIATVYGLVITFASGGVKLGATRLVSDINNIESEKTKSVMNTCIKYSLFTGISATVMLYLFSGLISVKWIADERAQMSLKALSLSLPAIAVSSAINGYFTAKKSMSKFAFIQLSEQVVKIILTVIMITSFSNSGTEYACFAISLGITLSEIFSAVFAYAVYRFENRNQPAGNTNVLHNLLRISLPEMTGGGCRSILLTVEHILIPDGFRKSGYSMEKAMSIYGVIHGMALPVILYPSAILSSLSSMLIPELSQLKSVDDTAKISSRASLSIRYALIFSLGAGIFFSTLSDTVSTAVYGNDSSSFYIRLLGVMVPVMYTDMITDGLLKGLDEQSASMRYNIIDSAVCVILVRLLVPKYSISGYVFILFLSEIINFSLSINRLIKKAQLRINIGNDIFKPIICGLTCCLSVNSFVAPLIKNIVPPQVLLVICALLCLITYLSSLYAGGSINKNDIIMFKSLIKNKNYA